MAWETIENVKPSAAKVAVPEDGVVVASRRAPNVLGRGPEKRYIVVKIGAGLARKCAIAQPLQKVRLLFGSGSDAGRIGVSVDVGGGFAAKRQQPGHYQLTIGSASAAGLFARDFPPFTVDNIEAVRPENGQPPMFAFKASAAMLAADDD